MSVPRREYKLSAFDIVNFIFSGVVFLAIAYPLYFVIIASFSDPDLVAQGQVILWPKNTSLFGYTTVLSRNDVWIGYRNTFFYTLTGTTFKMLVTFPLAYAISRREFLYRRAVMLFFVFTMFFNGGLIPTYLLIRQLNLDDTVWIFIIPFAVNVYNFIIARTFFETTIPEEMYESASLDGCSHWRFFLSIALPLSKAILAVITLYYAVAQWNDFFMALIYIRSNSLVPLQIVLRELLIISDTAIMAGTGSGYAVRYAATMRYSLIIVATVPILIIYPFMIKYFEKGVMIGALKG